MNKSDFINPKEQTITIESIVQKKKELAIKIQKQHKRIYKNYRALFSPMPPNNEFALSFFGHALQSFTFFDNIRAGWNIIKKVTSLFKRKR